jgi:hypothetical protein
MAVLFVGTTPKDMNMDPGLWSTSATGRDAAYSPGSVAFPASGPGPVADIEPGTGVIWWHFRWRTANANPLTGATTLASLFSAWNAAGQELFRLKRTTGTGNWVLHVFGDTTATNGSITFSTNVDYTFDIRIEVDTSMIAVEIWRNGTLVCTASAANTSGLKGRATSLRFDQIDYTSNSNPGYMTEMFVLDDGVSTLNKRLALMTPNTAGSATAWTGNVSALSDNDVGSNIFSDIAGQRESWNPTTSGGGSGSIHAVVAKVHGDSEGSGLKKIGQYIRKGGVNYDGTDTTIVPTKGNMEVWYLDPATGLGWVNTDLASIEVGLKSAP